MPVNYRAKQLRWMKWLEAPQVSQLSYRKRKKLQKLCNFEVSGIICSLLVELLEAVAMYHEVDFKNIL